MEIRAALKEGIARLRRAGTPSDTLAAELLLMHSLGRDRTWLYSHPESALDSQAEQKYFEFLARRAAGEPTQYITGKQEFWGLEFEVTPAVLIPRPETEHVMEVALELLGPRGLKIDLASGRPGEPLLVADVGTGSGCLAVALAWELPHAEIIATDISAVAMEVARRNAARHQVANRIHFQRTNLLENISVPPPAAQRGERCFDLIVSNPPYIGSTDASTLPREVREHEPHVALFSGPHGAELYPSLIEQARKRLRPGGILAIELGYNSLDRVLPMLAVPQDWTQVRVTNDLAGIPRVLSAVRL
ncbi:MAG: peptide chain release factor N(5)-glutamine methyltransferase [Candidatus Acidiferrales bacterium]